MKRRGSLFRLWSGLVCLALTGCTLANVNKASYSDPLPSNHSPAIAASTDDSRTDALGKTQHPRILALYGGEYSDTKLERMVAKIVGKLAAVAEISDETYRITMADFLLK